MTDVSGPAGLLVDAATLAAELESARPPVLIDARWSLTGPPGILGYRAGHLPGARFADLDTELAGRRGAAGRHPLPTAADFEQLMRRLGVRTDSSVVVYDAADSVPASRGWWDLRYFGHADVRVLDGGYAAWVAAGLPVTTNEPVIEPGDFVARPGGLPMLDADQAAAVAKNGVLIDVRVAERFRGEVEPVDPIAGRIPDAVNLPTNGNVDASGKFLDVETLAARFDALHVPSGAEIGAYCGSGVNAAHTVFAMTLAGRPTPALFVGSWSHWIADGSRPIAIGPA
ncbi:MAG: thiosulfate/3-mercaptopyruvate sulfurtransferase [Actinomycetota bacterium]|nr:thiosulfate/3-mercaptopyruvate sulfurtransferase [Actinomycetota bacterium]